MRAAIKITFFDDNDEKFFGEGPYRLLLAIEKTGSLRSASQSMGLVKRNISLLPVTGKVANQHFSLHFSTDKCLELHHGPSQKKACT